MTSSYDGRWAFAAIDAGATHVTCIEFEEQFAARIRENFELYGDVSSYDVYVGDVHERIREFPNDHFDVVLCLGFFYHTSQHVTLAQEMCRVSKKHIILDTRLSWYRVKDRGFNEY
ncbi:class I SAM-dependent methyltransferase [Gammaproteobacteria bacterium]|nr:class I SAM-dependent methyltransferase [Gammaproteobacteria bacterium]